jgi:hypothetical protein
VDGRIIRNIGDAIAFAPEQETRPGVDRRVEVLHTLERAREHRGSVCCGASILGSKSLRLSISLRWPAAIPIAAVKNACRRESFAGRNDSGALL